MKRIVRNLLFSALTALMLLGGAELLLRALDLPRQGLYAGDPYGLWWLRPGLPSTEVPFPERGTTFHVRTNDAGYRGENPPSEAILCLGDSTTFGWGVEEEEAWPAALAQLLGRPVANGGVPGYSTHQGLARLDVALTLKPSIVVLAYIVRDAEAASVPDHLRPAPPDLRLLRLMRPPPRPGVGAVGATQRVPPDRFAQNLRALASRIEATGARAIFLDFPMLAPSGPHRVALAEAAAGHTLLQPRLDPTSFFAEDPIHLTPAGHLALARRVAELL